MYVGSRSSESTATNITSTSALPVTTSAGLEVTISPVQPHAASSHSSCSSSFRSPASSTSRPALSSGQSSPPVDDADDAEPYGSLSAAGEDVLKRSSIDPLIGQAGESRRRTSDYSSIPHFASKVGRGEVTPSHNSTLAVKQAMASTSDQHRPHHPHHNSHPQHHSAGVSPSLDSDIEDHAGESGPSRSAAVPTSIKTTERPASKSRRMSPGGSRMPSEDPAFRNGYGRSASDSGSEWIHSAKSHSTATANDAGGTRLLAGISDRDGADPRSANVHGTGQDLPGGDDGVAYHNGNGTAEHHDLAARVRRPHLDLAAFPPQDLLRILAALLHQIATANDHLRPRNGSTTPGDSREQTRTRVERNAAPEMALATPSGAHVTGEASTMSEPDWLGDLEASHALITSRSKPTTAALGALDTPSSTLCFRARNIPSISIESYLLRILRYCPASCEVFVSLLVYFDRMSKMGQRSGDAGEKGEPRRRKSQKARAVDGSDADGQQRREGSSSTSSTSSSSVEGGEDGDAEADDGLFVGMRGFAIDSFNVHRLVIAGVTVASKFFSDVFYTNSRYAKVGGLPVHELNQLELQFLLLNDFNLMIPLEEMQKYADQLLVYGGVDPQAESPGGSVAHDIVSSDTAASASGGRADVQPHQGNTHEDHGDVAMHEP